MVEYTKKSRNIRHKTLKNRGDSSKIVGDVFGFSDQEKANKKLPIFTDFYDGFDTTGNALGNGKDSTGNFNLYEIQYLTNPTKKYNVLNSPFVIGERTDFLSLGNAHFIGKGKGSNFTTDTLSGKNGLPKDFHVNTIERDYNDKNYIIFELIDDSKYKEDETNKALSNKASAKEKIIRYHDSQNNLYRYFAIIYESENCNPGGNEDIRKQNVVCKDKSISRFFSHYIIKLKNKTIADIQSRFASGNRINSIADVIRRLLGPDSYLTIFKNEKFIPFMNAELQEKFKSCKDIGSQLCKDLNEKNSEFTRTRDDKPSGGNIFTRKKFVATDFKNINYLRLLFAIKYHFTKANDLGRIDMISIIFHLFKINFLNNDENQTIFNEKLHSSQITINVHAFMQNNAPVLPFIADMIGKVLIDGFHWYVFRDVKLTKDDIKQLVKIKDEIIEKEKLQNADDEEEAKDIAIAIDAAENSISSFKGGRPKSNDLQSSYDLQKDESKEIQRGKIVGGKPSRDLVDNLIFPKFRFLNLSTKDISRKPYKFKDTEGKRVQTYEIDLGRKMSKGDFRFFTKYKVRPIQSTRLGPLGTIQSTNKIAMNQNLFRFSLVDNNMFVKLINKYININEFQQDPTLNNKQIYEDSVQDILVGTLVSFFLKMYELNKDGKNNDISDIDNVINNKIKPYLLSQYKEKGEYNDNQKIVVNRLEQYILNLYQILFIYYEIYEDDSLDIDQKFVNRFKKNTDTITNFIKLFLDLTKLIQKDTDKSANSTSSNDPNTIFTNPVIDPVEYISSNISIINKKKEVVKKLKEIIREKYTSKDYVIKSDIVAPLVIPSGNLDLNQKNSIVTHSLYMLYDFHDIVEFFNFKNTLDTITIQKHENKIIGQNYPIIIVLNDNELEAFIDKCLYIEYTFVVDGWIKELVQNVGKGEIADFMITIADCLIEGVKQKCTSVSGIVGSVATSLFTFGKTPPLPCLTASTLLVRTVMAEWLDKESLLEFNISAKIARKSLEDQSKMIKDMKKKEKDVAITTAIASKHPVCYVQFDTKFQIIFIYVQHTDGMNNIFYIKHDTAGLHIQDISPIPKADILKYLVSSDTANFTVSSQPQAKLVASTIIGPSGTSGTSNILNLLKTNKGPLTGSMYGPIITNPNITPIEGVCLENIGASCYMNSAIQFLFCIPEVRTMIINTDFNDIANLFTELLQKAFKYYDLQQNQTIKDKINEPKKEISGGFYNFFVDDVRRVSFLKSLFTEMHKRDSNKGVFITQNELINNYKLNEFIKELGFTENTHEDASEFFTKLMGGINCFLYELNFFNTSKITCVNSATDNTSIKVDILSYLPINIQGTNIQECLDNHQKIENMNETEKLINGCGGIDTPGDAESKKLTIFIFPETKYMILSLSRFIQGQSDKITTIVDIKTFNLDGATFNIKAAILHQGKQIKSGHYVFAEYRSDGTLDKVFNDSNLTTRNNTTISGVNIDTYENQTEYTPYVLLYERQP